MRVFSERRADDTYDHRNCPRLVDLYTVRWSFVLDGGSDDLVALIFMYSTFFFCLTMVTFNYYYGVTVTTKGAYHLSFTVYTQIALTLLMVVFPSRIARFEVAQVEHSLELKRRVARYIYHEMRTPLNIVVMGP